MPAGLLVRRLTDMATLPHRSSCLAAGYVLFPAHDQVVPAYGKSLITTDITVVVPEGTYGRIAPLTGMAWRHHLSVGAGVVDRDYTGLVGVTLFNHAAVPFQIRHGDRVAQLILERVVTPPVVELLGAVRLRDTPPATSPSLPLEAGSLVAPTAPPSSSLLPTQPISSGSSWSSSGPAPASDDDLEQVTLSASRPGAALRSSAAELPSPSLPVEADPLRAPTALPSTGLLGQHARLIGLNWALLGSSSSPSRSAPSSSFAAPLAAASRPSRAQRKARQRLRGKGTL